MRPLDFTGYVLFSLLMVVCLIPDVPARNRSADSSAVRSANELVVDIARLIRKHANFRGSTVTFRYDAYADTVAGLRLYIGEEFNILNIPDDKRWYYIDFKQPIEAHELRIVQRKKGYFAIDAARRITRKIKQREKNGQQRERNARLFIPFLDNRKRRIADFAHVQSQLTAMLRQLVDSQPIYRQP